MQWNTASYTDIGGRACNEDAVRIETHARGSLCLVVADGLGGHGGGDVASRTAVDVICREWDGGTTPPSLIAPIKSAHRQIQSMQTGQLSMRTTVAMLATDGRYTAMAHAGDSRIYHFHNGTLAFQTQDHSASQIAVLMEEITPDQIRFHEDRNRVLRCLGQEDSVNPTARDYPMEPGSHAFLLCSDGFWEYVLEPEMEEDLRSARDPQDWLQKMRARLGARVPANHDNHTAAAVWFTVV